MARQQKGSSFERDICRQLSVWWTGDPDTHDIFWRTSQSGGRATSRAKAGKRNKHHCGDIAAIDPSGARFTNLVTPELKRGYPKADPIALLDRPKNAAQQPFEAFLEQAITAAERGGTPFWMIIHKRDRREAMVYFPDNMVPDDHIGYPSMWYIGSTRIAGKRRECCFYGMRLSTFLRCVPASLFKSKRTFAKLERKSK